MEEFNLFYPGREGPEISFEVLGCSLHFAEADVLLFWFSDIFLLWVHKQGGKIQDLYLECDTFQRYFCLGKTSISYGIIITPFPSLVIKQVKQSSSLLGTTSWAPMLNYRHLITVMTLGWYSLNFIFQSFEKCERMMKEVENPHDWYFWQHCKIFWCSLTNECAVFVQNLFCIQISPLYHEIWRQIVQSYALPVDLDQSSDKFRANDMVFICMHN